MNQRIQARSRASRTTSIEPELGSSKAGPNRDWPVGVGRSISDPSRDRPSGLKTLVARRLRRSSANRDACRTLFTMSRRSDGRDMPSRGLCGCCLATRRADVIIGAGETATLAVAIRGGGFIQTRKILGRTVKSRANVFVRTRCDRAIGVWKSASTRHEQTTIRRESCGEWQPAFYFATSNTHQCDGRVREHGQDDGDRSWRRHGNVIARRRPTRSVADPMCGAETACAYTAARRLNDALPSTVVRRRIVRGRRARTDRRPQTQWASDGPPEPVFARTVCHDGVIDVRCYTILLFRGLFTFYRRVRHTRSRRVVCRHLGAVSVRCARDDRCGPRSATHVLVGKDLRSETVRCPHFAGRTRRRCRRGVRLLPVARRTRVTDVQYHLCFLSRFYRVIVTTEVSSNVWSYYILIDRVDCMQCPWRIVWEKNGLHFQVIILRSRHLTVETSSPPPSLSDPRHPVWVTLFTLKTFYPPQGRI